MRSLEERKKSQKEEDDTKKIPNSVSTMPTDQSSEGKDAVSMEAILQVTFQIHTYVHAPSATPHTPQHLMLMDPPTHLSAPK